jgi:hypothetical protein
MTLMPAHLQRSFGLTFVDVVQCSVRRSEDMKFHSEASIEPAEQ